MQDDRIHTIIKEIHFWRENNLLPEVYCDFLLALYTKGEVENPDPVQEKAKIFFGIQTILMVLLIPFSFLILYFTQFPFFLQLGFLILFLSYSCWMYLYVRNTGGITASVGLINSMLLFLLLSITVSKAYVESVWFSYFILFAQFTCWYLLGKKLNRSFIIIISILAILFLIIYIAVPIVL
ncbi:hypothetical protein [Virgibacillus sp. SK37]|uniref:hypothetical protein n=1 Tax=Virgibacillus sp. SK37 TaxID=403957 RepID=UPI0004D0B55E|nr:hypothetical protein [Virgibacillus sp. SK37]AIF45389.1 hypothetical protein X953_09735 [Virgibacillus sp. SK37]